MKRYVIVAVAALSLAACYAGEASAQLQSQVVAGSDNGATRRILKTDSSGRLEVIGSAAGGSVYGPDAPNGAGTQNPVRIGGSTSPTLNTGIVYNWSVDSNGAGGVRGVLSNGASGAVTGLVIGGWDGTNYRHLNTTTTGVAYVAGEANNGSTTITSRIVPVGGFDGTNNRILRTNSNGQLMVDGIVNSGATDAGSPVKVGGRYNSTLPTFTDGQRGDLQIDTKGSLNTNIRGSNGAAVGVSTPADNIAASQSFLQSLAAGQLYDGTTFDLARDIASGGNGTGAGVAAVALAPNAAGNAAITPSVSTALEGTRVLKTAAGNLYRLRVTSANAGYIMVFNATSAPVNGAVTPQSCTQVSGGTTELDWSVIPARFSTGITVVFSSTGCFTKTTDASAMIEGFYQ